MSSILSRQRIPRLPQAVTKHLLEMSFFAGIGVAYLLVAALAEGDPGVSLQHAKDLVDLERRLGIFVEPGWQREVLRSGWLIDLSNWVYFWGHAPVLAVCTLLLYVNRRQSPSLASAYAIFRTGFVVAELVGMALYIVYPVAPPRLLPPEYGFADTLTDHSPVNYERGDFLMNAYAAFPSLHVAWVVLVAAMLLRLERGFLPFAMALLTLSVASVTVTANHYLLDAAGGAGVALLGIGVAWFLTDARFARIVASLRRAGHRMRQWRIPRTGRHPGVAADRRR